jgi:integrase
MTTARKGTIVKKKGRASFYVVVDANPDPETGRRRQQWHPVKRNSGETERQHRDRAEAELRRLLGKLDDGIDIAPERLSVAEYLDRWLADYAKPNLGGRTYESYESILRNHVKPVIGKIQLQALRPLDVQRIYGRMRELGLSGTSALHCHRVLREALHHAVKWDLIGRNVADAVNAPRSTTGEARIATKEELAKIVEAADGTPFSALIRLTLWTGMRLGEVLGLRWQDIDMGNRRLQVKQTYGQDGVIRQPTTKASRRAIALDTSVVEALDAHRKAQVEHRLSVGRAYDSEADLVFADPLGKPTSQHSLDRAWKHIRKAAGAPDLRFHDLRHAYASHSLAAGVPLHTIQARLGHAQASTTLNIYGHALPGADDVAAGAISQVLGRTADAKSGRKT